MAAQPTESVHMHGPDLFDQHPGPGPSDLDLGPKRRRSSASGGGCDDDHRSGKQLVGLDHHAEPIAMLLVADAFWRLEPVDVTPFAKRDPVGRDSLGGVATGNSPSPVDFPAQDGRWARSADP